MSLATRRAIYGKLAADTTLTNLLGTPAPNFAQSIYHEVAPSKASFPYVVFNKQSGTPTYSLKTTAFNEDVWMVRATDRNTTADLAEQIASRLDALLTDASLSISGQTQLYLRRESDIDYSEVTDGQTYRHAGSLFRLIFQPN